MKHLVTLVDNVIAVDDGSTDGTGAVLNTVAAENPGRIQVLSYPQNRGKGAALLEGFRRALAEVPFDLLITLDADGQHNPNDIPRLVAAWTLHRPGLLIGERLERNVMPLRSRFGNSLTSMLLRLLHSASPRDTQSGFRGMDRRLVMEIARTIKPQRYETELRILLLALEQRHRISTIAIKTIYFEKNRLSHFRPVSDSARIYWALFRGLCRSLRGTPAPGGTR